MFFIGVSLLLSLSGRSSRKKEAVGKFADRFILSFFLNGYPSHPYFGVRGESPIHLLIGQGAVNVPTRHHSTILNDLLPCFFSALGNHLKNSLEDVLCPYSVNPLLHILKTQPLIICIPLALHWITCAVSKPKMVCAIAVCKELVKFRFFGYPLDGSP